MGKKSMEKHIFKFEFGGPQRWGGDVEWRVYRTREVGLDS